MYIYEYIEREESEKRGEGADIHIYKHLPFGLLWDNKDNKLWPKLKCLVNELVCKGCMDSKRGVQPHDLLKKQNKYTVKN